MPPFSESGLMIPQGMCAINDPVILPDIPHMMKGNQQSRCAADMIRRAKSTRPGKAYVYPRSGYIQPLIYLSATNRWLLGVLKVYNIMSPR